MVRISATQVFLVFYNMSFSLKFPPATFPFNSEKRNYTILLKNKPSEILRTSLHVVQPVVCLC